MNFVNGFMLGGVALITVPIVLHLVMRQQPKQLMFPALRFILQREESNRRRMRFRHWLLLLARCLVIALLAAALARPSIRPEGVDSLLMILGVGVLLAIAALGLALAWAYQRNRTLLISLALLTVGLLLSGSILLARWFGRLDELILGGRDVPVAAALVFDTSPRMTYRYENQTRLEAARAFGAWVTTKLPAESEVAVLDSRSDSAAFAVDRGAAQKRIEQLSPTPAAIELPAVIAAAVERVAESDRQRKEVYVFTDLTEVAWRESNARELRRRLDENPEVQLYVVDLGVEKPTNSRLGDIRSFDETFVGSERLKLSVDLYQIGPGGPRTIELRLFDQQLEGFALDKPDDRPSTVRGRKIVDAAAQRPTRITFDLKLPRIGTHQGYLTIAEDDGLPADNIRYFTVDVRKPWRVLVAAPPPHDDYSWYLTEALSPPLDEELQRFQFTSVDLAELSRMKLSELTEYAAICLLDPRPLSDETWNRLTDYAAAGQGRSVALMMGREAISSNGLPHPSFNSKAAQDLLPAPLKLRLIVARPGVQLVTEQFGHPLLEPLRTEQAATIPWREMPIFRYWQLGPLNHGAQTVVAYSNGDPAIVERSVGNGRSLLMTTPITDELSDRRHWNRLPTGENVWPYIALMDGMMLYMVGSGNDRLNYFAGETAVIPLGSSRQTVSIKTPLGGDASPLRIDVDGAVRFTSTDLSGTYLLRAGGTENALVRGFSVNDRSEATRLDRLDKKRLDELLGDREYTLARSQQQIVRSVSKGRVGIKLYPWILLLLAVVLGGEHLLANLFYRKHGGR